MKRCTSSGCSPVSGGCCVQWAGQPPSIHLVSQPVPIFASLLAVLQVSSVIWLSAADYSSRPENFQCLSDCRKAVAEALGLPEAELELR